MMIETINGTPKMGHGALVMPRGTCAATRPTRGMQENLEYGHPRIRSSHVAQLVSKFDGSGDLYSHLASFKQVCTVERASE